MWSNGEGQNGETNRELDQVKLDIDGERAREVLGMGNRNILIFEMDQNCN